MPRFAFQVPGLGTVTMHEDTEACARQRLTEHIGVDPDRHVLVDRDPGAPVLEGDPTEPSSLARLDDKYGWEPELDGWDDGLLELRPQTVGLIALGAALLGALLLRR